MIVFRSLLVLVLVIKVRRIPLLTGFAIELIVSDELHIRLRALPLFYLFLTSLTPLLP
ncbi:hypothetical protein OMAG_001662 [Candidatus Omnitrophus magneticus]|uniref:Uncharacterized protein n=1 Tax=Candidatus Omnitrophus magneticus TaxID=1609969 RepID=A0A0F0CSP2_9BACT|nr:hypothetical protein OMAG_001662 [Candidatus Omnitrophus magneticus]